MIEINFKDKVKAYVREGTSDEFVVKEVFSGEYRKLDITSNDVIVDFGMNIGMFTIFALQKGAKKVHGYEAEPENFDIAGKNIQLNNIDPSRYEINNLAVVGNDDPIRYFSINKKKNKGAHSLISKNGRNRITVKCININKILTTVNPTIIKMDIEGAEYECLFAIKDFSGINQLVFEYHHAHLNDIKTHKKYVELLNMLAKHFPHIEAREETKGAWVNIVYCKR